MRADRWSPNVIGAAIEVHRDKGPGLLEEIYKTCLMHEFALRGIPTQRELAVPITYKDLTFEAPLRLDFYVDRCLIIEAKAVESASGSRCSALELHALAQRATGTVDQLS